MRRLAWFGLVCAIASCGDSTGPRAERLVLPDIRGVVAGQALEALDHNGRFRPTEPWSPSSRPLISPEFALAIAEIYLRDFIVNGSSAFPCSGGLSCQTMRQAIWRIVLDKPVTVRTLADGAVHETREVYVAVWPNINEANELPANRGGGLRISIASESQPDFEVYGEIVFPRRPEAPLHLREVEVVK